MAPRTLGPRNAEPRRPTPAPIHSDRSSTTLTSKKPSTKRSKATTRVARPELPNPTDRLAEEREPSDPPTPEPSWRPGKPAKSADDRRKDTDPTPVYDVDRMAPDLSDDRDCLVCIFNGPLGRTFPLESDEILIGREADCDVQIHHSAVSRHHARIERREGARVLVDLGSTNGTEVNGRRVREHVLRSGDHVRLGQVVLKYLSGSNVERNYFEHITRPSVEDELTGAYNRRFLLWSLERELSRAQRHDRPASLLMLDIDTFKEINDTHGHLCGDEVLRQLAGLLRERSRNEEGVARYGGDEFCILLVETALQGACAFARALAEIVRGHAIEWEGHSIPVTVSIGVAEFHEAMNGPNDLIRAADVRLGLAKRAGRDRVVCSDEPPGKGSAGGA